jgi:hypothetical protein
MADEEQPKQTESPKNTGLWCPQCALAAEDPLVCGDCAAVICRVCGAILEDSDEMAAG